MKTMKILHLWLSLVLFLCLLYPLSARPDVLSVFERESNGYILTPPTFITESPKSFFAGNEMYIGYFKPQSGLWFGNLKRYELPPSGLAGLLDESGYMKLSVQSDWSSFPDGNDHTKGGIAEVLNEQFNISAVSRNVYTFIENPGNATPFYRLSDRQNRFDDNNKYVTAVMLDVDENYRETLINNVRERGMGAVIHSRPLKVHYAHLGLSVIFIGDNNGFLHCIDSLSGEELWAFIMPEHLRELKNADKPLETGFVDNTPVLYIGPQSQKILIYGLGRGGYTYAALNISDIENPELLYLIKRNILEIPALGKSWGIPQITQIAGSVNAKKHVRDKQNCFFRDYPLQYRNFHDVAVLPGGYGSTAEGRSGVAVIGVNPLTGALDPAFTLLNSAASPIMQYSVLGVTPADIERNGFTDSLFFGDLGGNLFFATQHRPEPTGFSCQMLAESGLTATSFKASGQFVPYKLFQAGVIDDDREDENTQRIMFKPNVTKDPDDNFMRIYFGTGDRDNHSDISVRNKFYCLKFDSWQYLTFNPDEPRHLTEADLVDVTENKAQDGNKVMIRKALEELKAQNGWMLTLGVGEKVVSAPVVYDNIVYFTTYTPPSKNRGIIVPATARLYALDCLIGGAVFYWNKDPKSPPGKITAAQRSKIIGFTMPSAPELQIFRNRVALYVAVGEKIIQLPLPNNSLKTFYWREFY